MLVPLIFVVHTQSIHQNCRRHYICPRISIPVKQLSLLTGHELHAKFAKSPNGFYSNLPNRCVKMVSTTDPGKIFISLFSKGMRILLKQYWYSLQYEVSPCLHISCCLHSQQGLQYLKPKDGQPTWRNPFRAFCGFIDKGNSLARNCTVFLS